MKKHLWRGTSSTIEQPAFQLPDIYKKAGLGKPGSFIPLIKILLLFYNFFRVDPLVV